MTFQLTHSELVEKKSKQTILCLVSLLGASLLLCFFAMTGKAQTTRPSKTSSQFLVSFEQGGKRVPIRNHKVRLAKKPFELVVTLLGDPKTGMMLNVSHQSGLFQSAQSGLPLTKVFSGGTGMAEGPYGQAMDLMLNKDGHHYWWMNPSMKGHRFNKVKRVKGGYQCVRRVENLFHAGKTTPIAKVKESSLYLVFWMGKFGATSNKGREFQRDFIHIVLH